MKRPNRRRFLHLATGAAALPAVSRFAWAQGAPAQTYPAQPVRIIVGFGPGGVSDILARLIAQWLTDRFDRPFLVDNRPGGGTNIATETVARAPADGYTLLWLTSSNAINATLYDKLNFDFIRDIAPVASVVLVPSVVTVNSEFPPKTVPEFIAYAKANPGKINMGAAGPGSSTHVFGELFKMMAGVDLVPVQYRSSAPIMTDLMAGQVQVTFGPLGSSIEYIKSGRVRALAVTEATRSEALPDVPTVGEFVPGYEASLWQGIGAPKSTPPEIIDRLNKEINAGLADPRFKARLADLGCTPFAQSPAEFAKLIAADTEKWGKVIRAANIKAE
jgi:tripartite-type tricarboxylate transporter receptor subunit TctC